MVLARVWPEWRTALAIVQPATVIRWHRKGFALYWRWTSRKRGGRPRTDAAIRTLIREMARDNVGWGAPRIHGELRKLGFVVSEATVSRLMPRRFQPPSQTWNTFLANHLPRAAAIDFFVVPTATFRALYVFVVLAHERRRIVHCNVTDAPCASWTGQQVINAFPDETAPRYLHRDRDALYGSEFISRVRSMGVEQVVSAARSPWQNPYVERVIGSLRRECTDHVIVTGAGHLRRVLREYVAYYNADRTHVALDKDSPATRPVLPPGRGRVIALPRVGGLHHRYDRRAA